LKESWSEEKKQEEKKREKKNERQAHLSLFGDISARLEEICGSWRKDIPALRQRPIRHLRRIRTIESRGLASTRTPGKGGPTLHFSLDDQGTFTAETGGLRLPVRLPRCTRLR